MIKKLNVIDYIIISGLIICVIIGIYRVCKEPEVSGQIVVKDGERIVNTDKKIRLNLRIKNIREFAADEIKENKKCKDCNLNITYYIKNVKKENYYEYYPNESNTYVKYEYEDKYNVYFTIEEIGDYYRSGFYEKTGNFLGVGSKKYIFINGIMFECEVIKIQVI